MEELDVVHRLIAGMGSSETWMKPTCESLSAVGFLSRSLNFAAHPEKCLFSTLCTDPVVFVDIT